ncbi:ras-related protein M-Ras-like [Symsagittifera roscoffensis]|uniref:ras-related protein M-Ras-like n=1 Tax=Symsagittifera roscoffensis TaxID=84072 RepID=UPI00307B3A10
MFESDLMVKHQIVVVGFGAVGKSALTIQYFQKCFMDDYDPTIEDSFTGHKKIDGEWCLLEVLDTAGQEGYSPLKEESMRREHGFMLVFSVIDHSSLEGIPLLHEQILRVKDVDTCPMILVANKTDLVHQRKIYSNQGEEMAQKLGIPYVETSAKNPPMNVDKSFHDLVGLIKKQPKSVEKMKKESTLNKVKSSKCTVL